MNAAPLPQDGSGDGNDAVSQAGYKEGGAAPDTDLVERLDALYAKAAKGMG